MNQDEFSGIIRWLSAVYPNKEIGEDTVKAYWTLLQDLEADLFQGAAIKCASTSPFFPSPSDLRKAAAEFAPQLLNIPSAYEAWGQVGTALDDGAGHPIAGGGVSPNIHPLINKVVKQIGGWRYLSESENHVADRARFIQAYEQAISQYREEVAAPPMLKDLAEKMRLPPSKRKELTNDVPRPATDA